MRAKSIGVVVVCILLGFVTSVYGWDLFKKREDPKLLRPELQPQVDTIESRVISLEAKVGELDRRVDALEERGEGVQPEQSASLFWGAWCYESGPTDGRGDFKNAIFVNGSRMTTYLFTNPQEGVNAGFNAIPPDEFLVGRYYAIDYDVSDCNCIMVKELKVEEDGKMYLYKGQGQPYVVYSKSTVTPTEQTTIEEACPAR